MDEVRGEFKPGHEGPGGQWPDNRVKAPNRGRFRGRRRVETGDQPPGGLGLRHEPQLLHHAGRVPVLPLLAD